MQICRMDYNDVSADGRRLKLHVYGVGTFPVLSGMQHDLWVRTGSLMHRKAVLLIGSSGL